MNAPATFAAVRVREAQLRDDAARITGFVADHRDGTPFHLAEWSLAVARGCGQASHYLLAERADGEIAGVLPLTHVRSSLFGKALVSAGFGVGGGILAHDPATVRALADAAWALAARLGCPGIEVRGGPSPGPDWQCDDASYLGFVRNLAADDDAELAAIPRKQRAEVRRSFGNGLTIATGSSNHDLAGHYAVYAESVRNLGTPVFPKALFKAVLRECGERADILTVSHEGRAVASVLSLYWNGTVYPYWGGGTAMARGLRANDAMYYGLMKHARARGCTRFDFGRSKAGTGAAAFKKNWGFEPHALVYYARSPDGAAPREINPLDTKYAAKIALWKRLPLSVANMIGPFIARGLG